MIRRLIDFLTNGIFRLHPDDMQNGFMRWLLKQYKLLFYTARGVIDHATIMRSAALTFYTLMSIVPIAALIFAIVKGFGLSDSLTLQMHEALPQFSEFIDLIVGFANNALERTRGGLLATIGILMLFWAVMKVFGNIEAAFNNIWEVKRSRGIARQFSDYIAIVVIVPILWVASNAMAIYLRQWFDFNDTTLYRIWYNLASVAIIWVMFTLVYIVLPNTKVKFTSALTAGIVAGTAFALFQAGYVYLQSWMNSYNAIYGSFAALPLFLIWMQISWQIVLFGGELAFAYQNINKFEQERQSINISLDKRRKVMLAAMLVITRSFVDAKGAVSSEQISRKLNLPVRIVRDVIFDLEQGGLILAVKHSANDKATYYTPAKDVHKLTLYDVVSTVETLGDQSVDIDESPEVREVGKLLDSIHQQAYNSPLNSLFTDIK